ncbi:MAG: hypothetical protein HY259_00385 [Chloroflexi bacterium]|nr:hypothetical protein [Chloroflexota bacterium]
MKAAGLPGADLLWDGSGWNSAWAEADSATRFPLILPGRDWPDGIRRIYWRLLVFARERL